jgi:hypothetical protein
MMSALMAAEVNDEDEDFLCDNGVAVLKVVGDD